MKTFNDILAAMQSGEIRTLEEQNKALADRQDLTKEEQRSRLLYIRYIILNKNPKVLP